MKKLLFAIAALMTMTVANAQSVKEQIEARKRMGGGYTEDMQDESAKVVYIR